MSIIFRILPALVLLAGFHPSACADHISISNLWISEAPPVARVHAAYLTITNSGSDEIVLQQINSPDYSRIEIHRSIIVNDRMTMEAHSQISILPDTTFHFSPGDYHLMLFDPIKPGRAGDKINLIFDFNDDIQFSVSATIRKREDMQ